jgi:hypothetical protein
MPALKTVVGFAIAGGLLAMGARSQRAYEVEADNAVAPIIEQTVRMNAADFNPKVALVARELRGFSLGAVQITRSRIGALLDSALGGGDRNYGVYVSFQEDGDKKCMTLDLKWEAKTQGWKVTHPGADERCSPAW